jgi:DNA-binding Xre family transcriptional regulator
MHKIMTHEDVLKHMEKKYPGISQKVHLELANLRIGHKITELRQRRNITQAELARRAGLKQSNLARMEQARYTDYKLSTLSKIASAARAHLQVRFA